MIRRRRIRAIAVVGVATALIATVVANGTDGSTIRHAQFIGKPIAVQINTVIKTADFGDFSAAVSAVKAAARAINAQGGINHHRVVVNVCETQGDPNLEVACARSTVSSGAVVSIDSFIISNPSGYLTTLQQGHVADLAPAIVAPQSASDPNTFGLEFDYGQFGECTGKKMAAISGGSNFVGVLLAGPDESALGGVLGSAATFQHATFSEVALPEMPTSYSPTVGQVAADKPNTVIPVLSAAQTGPLASAAAGTGNSWTYCEPIADNLGKTLLELGATVASHFYLASPFPPLSAAKTIPAMATFVKQMKAEQAAGDASASIAPSNFTIEQIQAWLAMQVFKQVASSLHGTVTAAKFIAALNHTKFGGLGIISPVNFAKPVAYGPFTRVFNPYQQLLHWDPKINDYVTVPGSRENAAAAIG